MGGNTAANSLSLRSFGKLRRWLSARQWLLLALAWAAAIALGSVGFSKQAVATGALREPLDSLYGALQLFVLESGAVLTPVPWELEVARFLAPALAVYTAFQAVLLLLREQWAALRARAFRNHIVVCGVGLRGILVCRGYRSKGLNVVAIEPDRGNPRLQECRELGVVCVIGDARDVSTLRRAAAPKARQIVITCGADSTNMEVATGLSRMEMGKRPTSLPVLVHLVDPELYELLRERAILMSRPGAVRIELFNSYETGARRLLEEYPPVPRVDQENPHVMVVGVGGFGTILAVNIARRWHDDVDLLGRPRLTLVDRCDVEQLVEDMKLRYPELPRVCELIPRRVSVDSYGFESGRLLFDEHGECNLSSVYVCLGDDAEALRTALIIRRHIKRFHVPIVVRMSNPAGLATLLSHCLPDSDGDGPYPFEVLEETCTPDMITGCTTEIIARATHENYVRHQLAHGDSKETNAALVPWEELPETLKESNRDQAEHIPSNLRVVGCDVTITSDWSVPPFEFSKKEIELMSEREHVRYLEERRRQGWRWGPVKDIEKKTTPTLIPWEELSEAEREKDRIAVRGMPAFLARARLKVYRVSSPGGGAAEG